MRKLQIGDKLIIRPRLSVDKNYDDLAFTADMRQYRSKEATIVEFDEEDDRWYHIDLDDGEWSWSEDMFTKESFEEATKDRTFKIGDYVRVVSKEDYDNGSDIQDCQFEQIGRVDNVGINDCNINFRGCVDEKKFNPGYMTWWVKKRYLKKATEEDIEKLGNEVKIEKLIATVDKLIEDKKNDTKIDTLIDNVSKLAENSKTSQLEQAMIEGIVEKGKELSVKDIEEKLKVDLDKFIQDKYGVLPKKIVIENNFKKKELSGIFHKEFENICKMVASNIPLMLVGGAGAGKNHTLEQVAEALDLDFYTTNAVNQDFKLTGFIDANGKYHETEFYKAFKDGGMFFLDEIDASCPEALIILNGAIANRYFDFPVGRIKANENFRVVCAGNTYGTGADMVYVGRNVLDGATLDRFVVLQFDYDEEVEKQLAYDNSLFKFIRDLRQAVNNAGLRYIVSMRALINSTKLLEIGVDKKTILETTIIKNMQRDDLNLIVEKLDSSNEWYKEVKRLCD